MILFAAYFALLDVDNRVERVIRAEKEFVDSHPVQGHRWVETAKDGSKGKRYAGIGYTHDERLDAFIPPKPFPSWQLNDTKADWEAPKPRPQDGKERIWDEGAQDWVIFDKSKKQQLSPQSH